MNGFDEEITDSQTVAESLSQLLERERRYAKRDELNKRHINNSIHAEIFLTLIAYDLKIGGTGNKTHFKVGIDVLRDNVLGFGFVLTIDDVHVKFTLRALEQRPQIAHVLAAFFNGLQEHATGKKKKENESF